jgi:hypothetical protein
MPTLPPSPFLYTGLETPAPEPVKEREPVPDNMIMILEGRHPDELGLIPSFIDQADPRPAREQFEEHYAHGGGWSPIKGFKRVRDTMTLVYPGDPPLTPIAAFMLRDEMIVVYEHALVAIVDRNGGFEVARMD